MFNLSNNPLNLLLRFILELVALGLFVYLGAYRDSILLTFALPILAAAIWGIFRVQNDPGSAPVKVKGFVRLVIELFFFSAAIWVLYYTRHSSWALVFGIVLLVHYLLSFDRVLKLLKNKPL